VGKQNKAARKLKIRPSRIAGKWPIRKGSFRIIKHNTIENYTGWSVASRRQKANTSNETNRMKWNRNKAKRRQTKANRIFIAFISESIEKFTALKFYLERFASFIQRGASCWLFLRFPGVFPAIS